MKVFIVDDERPARERLRQLLSMQDGVQICGEADNGSEALDGIEHSQPDVVLMDIRMPKMDGMVAARRLSALTIPPALIFTTAYEEHAVEAFDTIAVSYLLKPIREEHLRKALLNARQLNRVQLMSTPGGVVAAGQDKRPPRSHLCVRLGNRLELIPISDVYFFQAEQKYVTVRHVNGEAVIEESLKSLEREFPERVLRIHRNALVAVDHIAGMEKTAHGRYHVVFKSLPDKLEVSRRLVATVRGRVRSL